MEIKMYIKEINGRTVLTSTGSVIENVTNKDLKVGQRITRMSSTHGAVTLTVENVKKPIVKKFSGDEDGKE